MKRLTDDERAKIQLHLQKELDDTCPACQEKGGLQVSDGLATIPQAGEGSFAPFSLVACSHCGHIMFFATRRFKGAGS